MVSSGSDALKTLSEGIKPILCFNKKAGVIFLHEILKPIFSFRLAETIPLKALRRPKAEFERKAIPDKISSMRSAPPLIKAAIPVIRPFCADILTRSFFLPVSKLHKTSNSKPSFFRTAAEGFACVFSFKALPAVKILFFKKPSASAFFVKSEIKKDSGKRPFFNTEILSA